MRTRSAEQQQGGKGARERVQFHSKQTGEPNARCRTMPQARPHDPVWRTEALPMPNPGTSTCGVLGGSRLEPASTCMITAGGRGEVGQPAVQDRWIVYFEARRGGGGVRIIPSNAVRRREHRSSISNPRWHAKLRQGYTDLLQRPHTLPDERQGYCCSRRPGDCRREMTDRCWTSR
jgi:hypothetical protein